MMGPLGCCDGPILDSFKRLLADMDLIGVAKVEARRGKLKKNARPLINQDTVIAGWILPVTLGADSVVHRVKSNSMLYF